MSDKKRRMLASPSMTKQSGAAPFVADAGPGESAMALEIRAAVALIADPSRVFCGPKGQWFKFLNRWFRFAAGAVIAGAPRAAG